MKNNNNNNLFITLFGFLFLAVCAYIVLGGNPSTNNITEEVREFGQDTVKEVKSGVRKVQDKTCEMIDGKVECAAKKAKHEAQNAADEIEDKLN